MDWPTARARFKFLADAFNGECGFAPKVRSHTVEVLNAANEVIGTRIEQVLSGPTQLVRYPRESDAKFAARNACAVYENHLRDAVERFTGFLGRKRPGRNGGTNAQLVKLFMENADLRGKKLDDFEQAFAVQLKARGSLLLVMDTPTGAPATDLGDQLERRRVPYVRWAFPENVKDYYTDSESGLFLWVVIEGREWNATEEMWEDVEYHFDTTSWKVTRKDEVLRGGPHGFGACPVLAVTETGDEFPVVGSYAQIADLSRRLFNARSERDEILRSQTFSLLTLQVPSEAQATFDAKTATATIGTHSMLTHPGLQPAFIAPDSGPATVYKENIEELGNSIRRISKEETTEQGAQAESGVARRLRFEALNAELATFARQLQQAEERMWVLFKRVAGSGDVVPTWPTDFNLVDTQAELDILTGMQMGGMPPRVMNEKRRQIVAAEFDNVDDNTKAALNDALNELDQVDVAAKQAADAAAAAQAAGQDPNTPN